MSTSYPNPHRIKIHRTYTYAEAAEVLQKHPNTITNWVRNGLRRVDDRKPYLILGRDLKEYLSAKRKGRKKPCAPGELYCMRCHAPRLPGGAMADYEAISASGGNLIAICAECGTLMYRRVRRVDLNDMFGNLQISFANSA